MLVTDKLRKEIAQQLHDDYSHKRGLDDTYTRTRHATYLGLNDSIHNRIIKGETEHVLKDEKWIAIARKLDVDLSGQGWKLAKTTTYNTITPQLEHCQKKGVGRVFSDAIGIGKTTACKHYMKYHPNVSFVNCKKARAPKQLMLAISEAFGFSLKKHDLATARESLVAQISIMDKPLIILDDAGYLSNSALLEVISLWDDLDQMCGWYMIGEPAFKERFLRQIELSKLGWEAWFSRFGERIMNVTEGMSDQDIAMLKRKQCEQIFKANFPSGYNDKNVQHEIMTKSNLSLRTLREDIIKYKDKK